MMRLMRLIVKNRTLISLVSKTSFTLLFNHPSLLQEKSVNLIPRESIIDNQPLVNKTIIRLVL